MLEVEDHLNEACKLFRYRCSNVVEAKLSLKRRCRNHRPLHWEAETGRDTAAYLCVVLSRGLCGRGLW